MKIRGEALDAFRSIYHESINQFFIFYARNDGSVRAAGSGGANGGTRKVITFSESDLDVIRLFTSFRN